MQGMLAVLAGFTLWLGPLAMLKLYVLPYWLNVVWLDVVTYLHHHGSSDPAEKMPWYRGEVSRLTHVKLEGEGRAGQGREAGTGHAGKGKGEKRDTQINSGGVRGRVRGNFCEGPLDEGELLLMSK